MMDQGGQQKDVLAFGPFTLAVAERRLTNGSTEVRLPDRTLDTLIALISRPNKPIDKRDLMALVWPDGHVSEASLRFHVANLRRALGDGQDGARFITTLAGRGYCFVAPVSRVNVPDRAPQVQFPGIEVPGRLARMVGRDDGVRVLATQLAAERFVTIVGAGGVGKTTVAVAVGHHVIAAFAGSVLFVDLGALNDPRLLAVSLASMLALSVQSDNPMPSLIAYLRDKRILLILDNCEHLIEAAATLATAIFVAAPQVHILATSREALRVPGEHVHRLEPLEVPPDGPGLTAAAALRYPAVQLFVERAVANGASMDLNDADAALVAAICRRLDGVALAIELAAARVEAYGLQQTAVLLEERLILLWQGQRSAPPRQQTLKATLDWSYGLLTALERRALRSLAVFVGDFTLSAALAVLSGPAMDEMLVLEAIESLIAKSMVATYKAGLVLRYRLLDTTRDYVLEVAGNTTEVDALAERHAVYYRHWLEQSADMLPSVSDPAERTRHLADISNVRAALEWCFSASGNASLGVGLAVAAAPLLLAMSLLMECRRWSARALLALPDTVSGDQQAMQLQASLGLSLMFTRGAIDEARAAFHRSLAIAERVGDSRMQLQLLSLLQMFHGRIGDPATALQYARRCADVSRIIAEPAALALGQSLLGMSLHFTGDLSGARVELEAALQYGPNTLRTTSAYLGFNGHILAGGALARTLWLQGHPAQALERARQTLEAARATDHPVTVSIALIWTVSVLLWVGDLAQAEAHIALFVARAESFSLGPYLAVGQGFRGQLAILRGEAQPGVASLRSSLQQLHAARHELLTVPFNVSLVQGLAATDRFAEAHSLIEETIRLVEVNGDLFPMAELLRVKGGLYMTMPEPDPALAETLFLQSLEWSRRQGARAWELRTATDLAALLSGQGRRDSARALLTPVIETFVEGLETADLQAAAKMLARLNAD